MIEIKLTSAHFEELIKRGYSLDIIFLIKLYLETDECCSGKRIDNLLQTMKRKCLLTDDEKVTEEGKKLLEFLDSKNTTPKLPKRKVINKNDDDFTRWWKTYPASDSFEYKNRVFKGSRALRQGKDDCRKKIEKILQEGEYSIEQLIEALKLEVEQKLDKSIKTGQNQLSYMKNSLSYLNGKVYEAYIELLNSTSLKKPEQFDGINI